MIFQGQQENYPKLPSVFGNNETTCKIYMLRGGWLVQLVERVTLDLRPVSSSPTLGVEIT